MTVIVSEQEIDFLLARDYESPEATTARSAGQWAFWLIWCWRGKHTEEAIQKVREASKTGNLAHNLSTALGCSRAAHARAASPANGFEALALGAPAPRCVGRHRSPVAEQVHLLVVKGSASLLTDRHFSCARRWSLPPSLLPSSGPIRTWLLPATAVVARFHAAFSPTSLPHAD